MNPLTPIPDGLEVAAQAAQVAIEDAMGFVADMDLYADDRDAYDAVELASRALELAARLETTAITLALLTRLAHAGITLIEQDVVAVRTAQALRAAILRANGVGR